MALNIQQTRVAASTATNGNTQTITITGFGDPKAAMFIVTDATADDTIAAGGMLSIGYCDSTSQAVVACHAEDGAATTDTDRYYYSNAVIQVGSALSAGDGKFSFNSWTTDGVILDIDTQMGAGYYITAIFFGGDDLTNAKVFTRDLQSSTSAQDYTGVGFEFDTLFLSHSYNGTAGAVVHSCLGTGIVINDNSTTPTQKSMAWCGDNGSGAGDQNTYIDNDAGLCATLLGIHRWSVTISDIDSTGFTHTNSASTGTDMIGLALKYGAGVSQDLFDVTIPTTGNYAETNPGFEPDFGMLHSMVGPSSYNSVDTSSSSGAFSIASFDSSTIYTNTATDKDGANPTVAKSLSSDQFRILGADGSTDEALASSYAFDSSGWDFTLSTNPSSSLLAYGWAVAGPAASGVTITPPTGSLTYTGYTPTVSIGASATVTVPAGALTYIGYAPSVSTGATLTMESDDFDSALGTVSSITNADTLTPTINLTPDDQIDVPGWLMLCVRSASNMSGKTPEFVYDDVDCRFTGAQNPCWRYLTDDRNTWYAFDNVATVTTTVTCSMNTPFTGEVEFATKPRWHYSDTQDWIAEVALDPDAHELASSVAATSLPTNVFTSVDPGATNANSFPQQDINLYGIRISNDSTQPAEGSKWPVVLLMGQHASEDQGNYMLQGFVDYLLSGTTLADRLLVDYDFYIYDVNPHGRAYGKERWSENDTTNSDLNRAWDGVPSGTVVDDIISAIGTDLSGDLKGMIDFHGNFQATRSFGAYYDTGVVHNVNFKTKMAAKVTEGFYPFYGPDAVGTSGEWGVNEGALFSITQEAEYFPAGHPNIASMYDQQGEALAETLDELRDEYYTIASPGVGALTHTGYAPLVQVGGNQTVAVPVASLDYTGYAPNVITPITIEVPVGTHTFTGYAPSTSLDLSIQPGVGSLSYTGYNVTVTISEDVVVSPGVGALTYTGFSPSIIGNDPQVVQPGVGAITYEGFVPSTEITYVKRVAFWSVYEEHPEDPNAGVGFWNN